MTLSARQEMAADLTTNLHKLGAWVVNPMPLMPGESLRFHVSDDARDAVLGRLLGRGWGLRFCGSATRFLPSGGGHIPTEVDVYELMLPRSESKPDGTKS